MEQLVDLLQGAGYELFGASELRIIQNNALPYAIIDPSQLSVDVSEGMCARLVVAASQNSTIDVVVHRGAQFKIDAVVYGGGEVTLRVMQEADSQCDVVVVEIGSARCSVVNKLDGEHCQNSFNGVYLAMGEDHSVINLRTEHNSPRCQSNSLVKGVAAGKAKGEFHGMVYVAKDSQQTDAQQNSRNIKLNDGAQIIAQPELEIYADDVKCTHGATVGQIDGEALFYMRQRGLSEELARQLQVEGFVDDVIFKIEDADLCEALIEVVSGAFLK